MAIQGYSSFNDAFPCSCCRTSVMCFTSSRADMKVTSHVLQMNLSGVGAMAGLLGLVRDQLSRDRLCVLSIISHDVLICYCLASFEE